MCIVAIYGFRKGGAMIVVTAPTGLIGHQVLENLLDSGGPVRVIVRDPSRLPPQARDRVEIVQGSHGDPHAVSVEAAYVDFTRPACDAFKRHEVRRVAGVSALGRGTAVAGHAGLVTASLAMDDLIAGAGVSYRALTMPSFMDNLLRQTESIKNRDVFVTPISGDRKLPSCATRDIAAVAARLLPVDSWSGAGHVAVLGPEDLSFHDMAQIMSGVLGKPVRYQQIPAQALKDRLTGSGMSDAMAQGTGDMMVAKDQGLDNAEPRTPESTTPTTFRQWCQEILKPAVLA